MDRGGVFEGMAQQEVEPEDCFSDFSEFDDTQAAAARTATKIIARAQRTRSRVNVRRASSEAVLLGLLPDCVEDGDSWHVISGGDIDSLSFAKHLLRHERFDYMLLSTWCMALDDVHQLTQWLDTGTLKFLDCYVGEIFPSQYPPAYNALCDSVRRHSGRVATFRNHSKLILLGNAATQRHLVVESSANINTNPRTEQTSLTADTVLFHFYNTFFNGIKSKARNFDSWRPYDWPERCGPCQPVLANTPMESSTQPIPIKALATPASATNITLGPDLVLVRGAPGSGKTTIAKALSSIGYKHFETDAFFELTGPYFFDPRQIRKAHAWCLTQVTNAITIGQRVVVSNTFIRLADLQPYIDLATAAGRTVQVIDALGRWRNDHQVPAETVQRMRAEFEPHLSISVYGQAT